MVGVGGLGAGVRVGVGGTVVAVGCGVSPGASVGGTEVAVGGVDVSVGAGAVFVGSELQAAAIAKTNTIKLRIMLLRNTVASSSWVNDPWVCLAAGQTCLAACHGLTEPYVNLATNHKREERLCKPTSHTNVAVTRVCVKEKHPCPLGDRGALIVTMFTARPQWLPASDKGSRCSEPP